MPDTFDTPMYLREPRDLSLCVDSIGRYSQRADQNGPRRQLQATTSQLPIPLEREFEYSGVQVAPVFRVPGGSHLVPTIPTRCATYTTSNNTIQVARDAKSHLRVASSNNTFMTIQYIQTRTIHIHKIRPLYNYSHRYTKQSHT